MVDTVSLKSDERTKLIKCFYCKKEMKVRKSSPETQCCKECLMLGKYKKVMGN